MELQGEDLETYNRLRNKYQGVQQSGMPADPNAPGAELWQPPQVPASVPALGTAGGKGTDLDVRMCPVCQGAGTVSETYQHRRMEKYCTTCSGQGVRIFKNNVEVVPGDSHAGDDTSPPPALRDQRREDSSEGMSDEEAEQMTLDIAALEEKYQGYTKERQQAELELQRCSDATEKQLRQAVITQLAAQCKKLRVAIARKEAQLRLAGRL